MMHFQCSYFIGFIQNRYYQRIYAITQSDKTLGGNALNSRFDKWKI